MFEAFEMIMNRLIATHDAYISYIKNGDNFMDEEDGFQPGNEYHITLEDFEGFDENWSEIMRDFNDEEMIDALFDLLHQADEIEDDFYVRYHFADFSVVVGYASYDI